MQTLLIKDETVMGDIVHEFQLDFNTQHITVADLIKERIISEVAKYQQTIAERFTPHALVTPTETEARLNEYKNKQAKRARVDVDKQVKLAWNAFENNGFFILFDDEQVEDLQQQLLVTKQSKVTFVKLTPLVGG
ncbi:MAG: hypothetical protein CR974_02085 [Gammaproteobacteria bacterium]|nr:MAG: hypothetical protein CR974_02085 [Gammaproteobacteria bacterium]